MRTSLKPNYVPMKCLSAGVGLTLVAVLFFSTTCTAQTTDIWTWINGDSTLNSAPVYGTRNVPAATNNPGARFVLSGWSDAAGNFWIFGGADAFANFYNDLWMYNPVSKLWTWVSGDTTVNNPGVYGTEGVAAPGNLPGGRGALSSGFADGAGNLYIFGGEGLDASGNTGALDDLWKYNISTGQWTWVTGTSAAASAGVYGTRGTAAAGNYPGGRYDDVTWYDGAGHFWVFGGFGVDGTGNTGVLNDFWEYDVASNRWTWVSGESAVNFSGNFGTEGVTAPSNEISARYAAVGAFDKSGNFYLFGGRPNPISTVFYNDLWKFNSTSNQWTWIGGNSTPNSVGVYGTQGLGAVGNAPGARAGGNAWTDAQGNFWIFGGGGLDGTGTGGYLNDLWSYNVGANEWTWINGSSAVSSGGLYGTQGVGSTSTDPGARGDAASWTDPGGNFWLMGGDYTRNDLWEITPPTLLALVEVNLQAIPQTNDNLLTWQTVMETNATDFFIEKSTDGVNFSAIGKVAAVGNGNNSYSFADTHPVPEGNVFYRLKIDDFNADSSFSQTVVLTGAAGYPDAGIAPNPASSGTILTLPGDQLLGTTARLLDVDGRTISKQMITNRQQFIDLRVAARGVYFLQLANGSVFKILKE